jgi:hypothetical protein
MIVQCYDSKYSGFNIINGNDVIDNSKVNRFWEEYEKILIFEDYFNICP